MKSSTDQWLFLQKPVKLVKLITLKLAYSEKVSSPSPCCRVANYWLQPAVTWILRRNFACNTGYSFLFCSLSVGGPPSSQPSNSRLFFCFQFMKWRKLNRNKAHMYSNRVALSLWWDTNYYFSLSCFRDFFRGTDVKVCRKSVIMSSMRCNFSNI